MNKKNKSFFIEIIKKNRSNFNIVPLFFCYYFHINNYFITIFIVFISFADENTHQMENIFRNRLFSIFCVKLGGITKLQTKLIYFYLLFIICFFSFSFCYLFSMSIFDYIGLSFSSSPILLLYQVYLIIDFNKFYCFVFFIDHLSFFL